MTLSTHLKQYKLVHLVIFALLATTIITLAPTTGTTVQSLANDPFSDTPNVIEPVVADFWQKPSAQITTGNKSDDQSNPRNIDPTGTSPALALDYASIEDELLKIKVDENGDVILDRDASNRIAAGFQDVTLPLDPELIKHLQLKITQSLPSPLGSQVADIISGYHEYLVAIQDEQAMFGSPQNIEEHKRRLEQKMELQSLILGESNARKLFAQENSDQMFMLEGMQVATNPELTPEQRKETLAKLEQQRLEIKPSIYNWDSRYEQFERNREAIEDAALSNGDKTQQIRSLYKQSFDMAERAQIEEMGAVSLN